MQRDPLVAKASELLRLDLMPSLDEIRNGKVSLKVYPPFWLPTMLTGPEYP